METVSRILILCWVLLFGGHWVGLTLLNWFGFVSLPQIADWNDTLFSRLYLVLLAATLLVLILRTMREKGSKDDQPDRRSAV
jgi:hypothetical protein